MSDSIYIVKDISFRYGEINKETRYYFRTEEEQINFFSKLKKTYLEIMELIEYEPNSFHSLEESKWSYAVEREYDRYYSDKYEQA